MLHEAMVGVQSQSFARTKETPPMGRGFVTFEQEWCAYVRAALPVSSVASIWSETML